MKRISKGVLAGGKVAADRGKQRSIFFVEFSLDTLLNRYTSSRNSSYDLNVERYRVSGEHATRNGNLEKESAYSNSRNVHSDKGPFGKEVSTDSLQLIDLT